MAEFKIERLASTCGGIIHGVDMSDDLGDNVIGELRQALLDHQVIFFRDQDMTPDQHKAFGRRFGTLNVHPQYVNLEGHPEILPVLKDPDAEKTSVGSGIPTSLILKHHLWAQSSMRSTFLLGAVTPCFPTNI